jgi:hypothetical protein
MRFVVSHPDNIFQYFPEIYEKKSLFKKLSKEIRRLAARKYFPIISENLRKKFTL